MKSKTLGFNTKKNRGLDDEEETVEKFFGWMSDKRVQFQFEMRRSKNKGFGGPVVWDSQGF